MFGSAVHTELISKRSKVKIEEQKGPGGILRGGSRTSMLAPCLPLSALEEKLNFDLRL